MLMLVGLLSTVGGAVVIWWAPQLQRELLWTIGAPHDALASAVREAAASAGTVTAMRAVGALLVLGGLYLLWQDSAADRA